MTRVPRARPFFTVVVPTFQAQASLASTLASLAEQSSRDFEVVVSDGGSRDLTVAVARSFAAELPRLVVSARPDSGVYDAVNKALPLSQGEWILVLGSGDRLHGREVLADAKAHLEAGRELLVYGDVRVCGKAGWANDGALYDGPFGLDKLLHKNICQQAIFYHRQLFASVGDFEPRYRVCADWDFALRVFSRHRTRYIPLTVCDFAGDGISSSRIDEAFLAERPLRLLRYFGLRVLSRRFSFLRGEVRLLAGRLLKQGHPVAALVAFSTYVSLGLRARFFRAHA